MTDPTPQVLVAQAGARMHYAVPIVLNRLGYLSRFVTDAYAGKGSWLHPIARYWPTKLQNDSLRRLLQRQADLPAAKISAWNGLGFRFVLSTRQAVRRHQSVDDVMMQQFMPPFLKYAAQERHLRGANITFAYTRAALELFEKGKEYGLCNVLEQMSAPVVDITHHHQQEVDRWPGWQNTEARSLNREALMPRAQAEWGLSDTIIAPSHYVRDCLLREGVPAEKIELIPYAVSVEKFTGKVHCYDGQRPLRVLFVGTVELRKGAPYLLEALRQMGPKAVEARFLGSVMLAPEKLTAYRDVAQILGRVARQDVPGHYDWADVFVLPSVCEGSATVTYEARACGLPVVATFNSGAWTEHSVDGLTIEAGSVSAIVTALESLIQEPTQIEAMSQAALRAAPNYSWDAYQNRLGVVMESLLNGIK